MKCSVCDTEILVMQIRKKGTKCYDCQYKIRQQELKRNENILSPL